jgi:hypothetical protein
MNTFVVGFYQKNSWILNMGNGSVMRILITGFSVLLGIHAIAQISHGGTPVGWGEEMVSGELRSYTVSPADAQEVRRIGEASFDSDGLFEWGIPLAVELNVLEDGSIHFENGVFITRIEIASPGAVMMSLQFSEFDLQSNARLYLFNATRTKFIGAFTEQNELPDGSMATEVIPGDRIVLEYQTDRDPRIGSSLVIAGVVHGVRDIFNFGGASRDYYPGYSSLPCHNNIVCPVGNGWEEQARATAMFLNTGGTGCTGVLVNNTLQDGTPYFHIANHCYQTDIANWVFYWNYQSPSCIGDTGQTMQTMVGASYVAGLFQDDFTLLQLFSTPPPSYDVYYSGWDATGTQPLNQTVIHHPAFDVKKITVDWDPAGSYTDINGITMWSCTWDTGIVQFGSSGAPLFDQNHRLIGHMTEGSSTCADVQNSVTGCAKFSESWNGSTPQTRLHDWLDPSNTTLVLDGWSPNAPVPITVPLNILLAGPYNSNTGLMNDNLRSNGLLPLTEPYTSMGFTHVGEGGGESVSPGVLATSGAGAMVDWVVIELRDKSDSTVVVGTRSALLTRSGDVVELDGNGPVEFGLPADDYYVAIHHRNHLSVMTAAPITLSSATATIDISSGTVPLYGGLANATDDLGGVRALVAGDANGDGDVKYIGASNDRDRILLSIGGSIPTNTAVGYLPTDLNLDGVTKYVGSANDRDFVLISIGGSNPTVVRSAQLP